jgi:hypothetical protein
MLPDMLRAVVSIRMGAILPSDIPPAARQPQPQEPAVFARRELGRVVRSMFLLRYLSDLEPRHVINAATTKSNEFVQWVPFGGDSLQPRESSRDSSPLILCWPSSIPSDPHHVEWTFIDVRLHAVSPGSLHMIRHSA